VTCCLFLEGTIAESCIGLKYQFPMSRIEVAYGIRRAVKLINHPVISCYSDELIACMEMALAAFSTGRVQRPVRNMPTIEEGIRSLHFFVCLRVYVKECADPKYSFSETKRPKLSHLLCLKPDSQLVQRSTVISR
jgi:hypothetical protein